MKDFVFLFDGQGAFRPGIGKELADKYPAADETISKSSDVLGYDLKTWLWGDKAKDTSSRTSIAQPAISTIALAYAAVLRKRNVMAALSLGHSLGEVTAIVDCGILSFEDGIKVIRKRGALMEKGGKHGTMMAVINIEVKELEKLCSQVSEETSEPVVVANINAPSQIVISGSKGGIKKIAQLVAQQHGRGIPLKVGGAWHSPYLKDAANEFAGFLDTITFKKPSQKFYSVVRQKILDDPEEIKASLKEQMLSQVNWVAAIQKIKDLDRYPAFLEIGPSKILKDLVLKIDPKIHVDSIALYSDIDSAIQKF